MAFKFLVRLGCAAFFAMLAGLGSGIAASQTSTQAGATSPPGSVLAEDAYKLGTGDKLRLTVFGEADLSGEFEIDGSGFVRLPLIGQVGAAGLEVNEFEQRVKAALEEGYLRNARVSAEVINYRPFYIFGQVNKPGEYPFVNAMSVLNAVAVAGGYTYRASESNVYIRRKGVGKEERVPASEATKVYPGDIIRIPERFF